MAGTGNGSGSTSGSSSSSSGGSPPRRALEGLRVRGPDACEYQICEDWPRRGDFAGDTYRAARRDAQGKELIVALKVSKACVGVGPTNGNGSGAAPAQPRPVSATSAAGTRAWAQEVQLLRRLALLGKGQQQQQQQDGVSNENGSASSSSSSYTVELVTEFGGVKGLPSLRFLVTTPVCWKSLDARIKVRSILVSRFRPMEARVCSSTDQSIIIRDPILT